MMRLSTSRSPFAHGRSFDILYAGTLPPHPGGSAISAAQILVGLAQRGHRVRAIGPITASGLQAGDQFALDHPEIRVIRFQMPDFQTLPFLPAAEDYRQQEHAQVVRFLQDSIAERRPDILFAGRETFAGYITEVAARYSLPSILRVAGGTTLGLARGNYPETLAEKLLAALRRIDLLVSPGEHPRDLLNRLGVHNVDIIFNAVDTERFAPRPKDGALLHQLNIATHSLVIGYVAGIHPRKRPLDLVASAARLLPLAPNLTFLMVGEGISRAEVERTCEELGIRDRFRFPGWVEYGRVPEYMNLMDIMVLPSDGEGLARVYLEAQALGKVLIASDIPPAREVVIAGETGLLFGLGDVQQLTDRILEAAHHPKLREDIGRKARQAAEQHSIEAALSSYEQVLERVIAEHHAKRPWSDSNARPTT